MNKIFRPILLIISVCFLTGARAAKPVITHLDDLLDAMDKQEETVSTIKFNFEQRLIIAYSGEMQRIVGKAYFKKPMSVRVENTKPEKNIFITNGKDAWYYSPALKQVMKGAWDDIADNAGSFFQGILNANGYLQDLKDRYTLIYEGKEDSWHVLSMHPKEERKNYFSMKLWIDDRDFFPYKTELVMNAMTIRTEISKVKFNKNLSDTLFTFEIPPHVEQLRFP